MILVGLREELLQRIAQVFALNSCNSLFEDAGLGDTRQDGRVRTLVHALHATHAFVGMQDWNVGCQVAETAMHRR